MDNNTERIAKPFRTLEELYSNLDNLEPWPEVCELRESAEYVYSGQEICLGDEFESLSKFNRDKQPKTIVCHDMKGGYLEDRFIDGSSAQDSYIFYHWSIIDIFIYFSHYTITIPPYGWIHTAHKHGVKVLGTVITERTDGEKVWEQVLSSMEETKKFADALIMIAKHYKFEGWLLNIENKINHNDIDQLKYFVQYLTYGIHSEIDNAEIIWYDSVTTDGSLLWQNKLNDRNKDFFENCDGIFLNYNWTDAGLLESRSIAECTNRTTDIYVGLDVWGRGCPGGGGFNSIEALKKIRDCDLSVAIFAPGWTHEYFNGQTFELIENIFWAQLLPFMYIHVPIYDNEIFVTTFCRGYGEKYFYNGESDETSLPFYNLAWQEPQISIPNYQLKFTHVNIVEAKKDNKEADKKDLPVCTYETLFHKIIAQGSKIHIEDKPEQKSINCIQFFTKYSYNGGGCIKINVNRPQYHRLFLIHLEHNTDIQVIIIHRTDENNNIQDDDNKENYPVLIIKNNTMTKRLEPYENFELNSQWKQSYYRSTSMKTINELGVIFTNTGSFCLGKIQIQQMPRII
ncbi:cytosolic endo-beta-N-acetylglucosaminidase [Microplitis mediator]|uniref:cytosolic endo-beta-N-acetylglucosaminidase n=1 Tax=Microplitis mediator TaxID=375433 RepID=UPI002552B54B|nr:cytosolic endo-beta-N-acetylglucosaminidase [Microplitis mediator]